MSSAKSSGTAGHGSSTPRRFHSPTFGSPAGIVLRPTRPQSPVPSPSTPTRRATVHDSRRKRVISLTPTSPAARSHVTPTPSSSTPLSSQRASQMPSLDLAERKSSVPLKEFEKVITDLKKENFNLKLRLFHYEEDNAIPIMQNDENERLLEQLEEQKEMIESLRIQLGLAHERIASLEQELDKPTQSVGVQTDMVRHDFDFNDSNIQPEEESFHYLSNISSDGDDNLVLSRESSISSNSGRPSTEQQRFVTNANAFALVHPLTEQRWDDDLNHITRQLHHVNLVSPTVQRNRAISGWIDRIES
ncbi:hypothetical protein Unana1_05188 [Umbelopsis nana]